MSDSAPCLYGTSYRRHCLQQFSRALRGFGGILLQEHLSLPQLGQVRWDSVLMD
jgi:hypothetical protein